MILDYYLITACALAILLFLGTPGPVTLLVVNSSVSGGFRAGLATVIGTNMASLILIALSFVVVQGVLAVSPSALLWLTLTGSFYVLYFSFNIITSKVSLERREELPSRHYFRNGFFIGMSNPKDILFFIAFFPSFFAVSSDIHASMAILIIWMILDYSILLFYSATFSKLTNEKMANLVSRTSGAVLFLLATYAIYSTLSNISNT